MRRLADGDTAAKIPATRAADEIGAMARTVIVFRDTMIERERLTSEQIESARAKRKAWRKRRRVHCSLSEFGPAGARTICAASAASA